MTKTESINNFLDERGRHYFMVPNGFNYHKYSNGREAVDVLLCMFFGIFKCRDKNMKFPISNRKHPTYGAAVKLLIKLGYITKDGRVKDKTLKLRWDRCYE